MYVCMSSTIYIYMSKKDYIYRAQGLLPFSGPSFVNLPFLVLLPSDLVLDYFSSDFALPCILPPDLHFTSSRSPVRVSGPHTLFPGPAMQRRPPRDRGSGTRSPFDPAKLSQDPRSLMSVPIR